MARVLGAGVGGLLQGAVGRQGGAADAGGRGGHLGHGHGQRVGPPQRGGGQGRAAERAVDLRGVVVVGVAGGGGRCPGAPGLAQPRLRWGRQPQRLAVRVLRVVVVGGCGVGVGGRPVLLVVVVGGRLGVVALGRQPLGQPPEGGQGVEGRVGLVSGRGPVEAEVPVRADVLDVGRVVSPRPVQLEALGPPQEAAVAEHVPAPGVQRPVVPFPRPTRGPRDLDEAVIEGEVVADGVLPPLLVLLEVGEAAHDEGVDLVQRHHAVVRALDGHGDEGDVGVGRLDVGEAAVLLGERGGAGEVVGVHGLAVLRQPHPLAALAPFAPRGPPHGPPQAAVVAVRRGQGGGRGGLAAVVTRGGLRVVTPWPVDTARALRWINR